VVSCNIYAERDETRALGRAARTAIERYGKKKWRHYVAKITKSLKTALEADYVVLGGGNSKKLKQLPPGTRLGNNKNAFLGGFRMWHK